MTDDKIDELERDIDAGIEGKLAIVPFTTKKPTSPINPSEVKMHSYFAQSAAAFLASDTPTTPTPKPPEATPTPTTPTPKPKTKPAAKAKTSRREPAPKASQKRASTTETPRKLRKAKP